MPRPHVEADETIDAWLAAHPGWARRNAGIAKQFSFADYPSTIAFVTRLAFAAEKRDHHPDLVVTWGKVDVVWTTHDAGGTTALDLELAARCEELAK